MDMASGKQSNGHQEESNFRFDYFLQCCGRSTWTTVRTVDEGCREVEALRGEHEDSGLRRPETRGGSTAIELRSFA
jgi:hypothetical protein